MWVGLWTCAGAVGLVGSLRRWRRITEALHGEVNEARRGAARERTFAEHSSDLCFLVQTDGQIAHSGPSSRRVLGYAPETLSGQSIFDLAHPDDFGVLGAFLLDCGRLPADQSIEVRLRDCEDAWRDFQASGRTPPRFLSENGVLIYFQSITARKRAEAALRASEERYALAARGANDGLWDWNLDERRVYLSPRWKAMAGYEESELNDDPAEWMDRIHPADVDRVRTEIREHVEGRASQFQSEYRLFHRQGHYRWMLCRGLVVRDLGGRAYRIVGSQTDVTDRKTAESRLEYAALHDALTELPNRVLFAQSLTQCVQRPRKSPAALFAVLYVDMDRFKYVNDSLGHHAGDTLLQAFTLRLLKCVRGNDVVARQGGDEFAILLDALHDLEQAVGVAERIHQELRAPFLIEGQEIFVSASIGIASTTQDAQTPEDLLRDADTALYEAKSQGKSRTVLFDAAMHQRVATRLELENDLQRAIDREEFVLHYQPVVEVGAGMVAGFEALVRWNHPTRGLLAPDAFIPVAEENGAIEWIDSWVLAAACAQLSDWRRRFRIPTPLTISVNLSSRRLAQPDLVQEVSRVLGDTGLPGSAICLEITETSVIENPVRAQQVLRDLKALGVRLAMDDFGTGHSSLSNLHRFPFDLLKIDRSFVQAGETDPRWWDLSHTIVALGHSLGMCVVAEGVEKSQDLARLENFRCDYAQGYYYSEPVDSAGAERLLSRWVVTPSTAAEVGPDCTAAPNEWCLPVKHTESRPRIAV